MMKKIYTHLTSLSPKVEMICLIDLVFVNSSNIYKFQHIVVYTKLPTNKERGCDPLLGLMWSSNPTTLPSSHDQTRTSTQKQTVLNSFVRNPAPSGCDNNTLPAKVVATGHWPPSSFLFPFVFPPIFTCTLIIPHFLCVSHLNLLFCSGDVWSIHCSSRPVLWSLLGRSYVSHSGCPCTHSKNKI